MTQKDAFPVLILITLTTGVSPSPLSTSALASPPYVFSGGLDGDLPSAVLFVQVRGQKRGKISTPALDSGEGVAVGVGGCCHSSLQEILHTKKLDSSLHDKKNIFQTQFLNSAILCGRRPRLDH